MRTVKGKRRATTAEHNTPHKPALLLLLLLLHSLYYCFSGTLSTLRPSSTTFPSWAPCLKLIVLSILLLVLGLVIVVPCAVACLKCPLLAPPAPLAPRMGMPTRKVVGEVMGEEGALPSPLAPVLAPPLEFARPVSWVRAFHRLRTRRQRE
jgi:hypothetical protein